MNNIYTTTYIFKLVIIPKALNMANVITTQNRTISKEVVLHEYNINRRYYTIKITKHLEVFVR